MEVILREHVENLGRRGDVVKVAAGYARNFLLPQRLALPVTEASRRQIAREREKAEARDAAEKAAADAMAQRIASVDISIARRVGENQTMYGSVTSADIAQVLAAKGFSVEKRRIHLPEPIKSLGEHTVPVKVHRDVSVDVKVKVVAEGTGS
jgi:large subunit ribosomal protein L9